MTIKNLLKKLNSSDYFEIQKALAFISSQKRSDFQLTEKLRVKIKNLFYYEYPDKTEPECIDMQEDMRRDAVLILGLYFGDKNSLDALIKLIQENKNSVYVLSSVIAGMGRIGSYADQEKKVIFELVNVIIDVKYHQSLRNLAYVQILHLLNKISTTDYVKGLEGKLDYEFDYNWLELLQKNTNF